MLLKESTNKSEVLQSLGRACRRGDHSVALLIAFEGTPIGKLGRGRYCFKNGSYDEAADAFIHKRFKKHLGHQVSTEASPARVPISAPVTEVVPLVSASALGGSSGGSSGLGASGGPDKKRGRAEETVRQPQKLVRRGKKSFQELLLILKENIKLLEDFFVQIHAQNWLSVRDKGSSLEELEVALRVRLSKLTFERLLEEICQNYEIQMKDLAGGLRYFSVGFSGRVALNTTKSSSGSKPVIQLSETQESSFTLALLEATTLKRPPAAIAVEITGDKSKRVRVEEELGVPEVIIPVQESLGGGSGSGAAAGSAGSGSGSESGSSSDGPASATAASTATSGSGMALAFGAMAVLVSPQIQRFPVELLDFQSAGRQ
jgi:hypothetical protein